MKGKYKVQSASTLEGFRVRSRDNQDLGTIEELMIDPASGRVAYAVLCFGGFLGFGDKLFAVPWGMFKLKPEDRVFVLDVDRDVLENAPGFDADDWPDFGDEHWGAEIHTYYGRQPYWSFSS